MAPVKIKSRKNKQLFETKFGKDFHHHLPSGPGVYFFYTSGTTLPIYVGKAKNLRRRLNQYRNSKRCKKHYKMKAILELATRLEFQETTSETEALLLENKSIRTLRPKFNVEGAFSFLYPQIAFKQEHGSYVFCYTTLPEHAWFLEKGFQFFGSFRSRLITREAFESFCHLLKWVGHIEKLKPLENTGLPPYTRLIRVRNLAPEVSTELLADFFSGNKSQLLTDLILLLVENAGARAQSETIQDSIKKLKRFFVHEAKYLNRAIQTLSQKKGKTILYPIPQCDRDALFIEARDLQT